MKIVSSVYRNDYGHITSLKEKSERIGKVRGRACGRISRLGVHAKNVASFENLVYGSYKMYIRCELSRADSSNKLEKPRAAIKAVNVYNVVDSSVAGRHRNKLKIYKRHMITEKNVRTLKSIHSYFLDLLLFADKHDLGKHTYEPNEEQGLTDRIFCSFIFFWVFIVNIHISPHRVKMYNSARYRYIIHHFVQKIKSFLIIGNFARRRI